MDVITTLVGLSLGAVEVDPETLYLMEMFGVVEALLLKFFGVVLGSLVVLYSYCWSVKEGSPFARFTRICLILGFGVGSVITVPTLINNFQVILNLLS